MKYLHALHARKIETEITRKEHQLIAINPDDRLLIQYLQLLTVLQDLLSKYIVHTTIGILIGDCLRRVFLPAKLTIGLIVDERTAVEHWRQNGFAVTIIVKVIQFGIQENGKASHFEQSLIIIIILLIIAHHCSSSYIFQLNHFRCCILLVLLEDVVGSKVRQSSTPPHRVLVGKILL